MKFWKNAVKIEREMGKFMRKFGLGKGLDALLPLDNVENPASELEAGVAMLPLDSINANPNQPRKTFDDAELEELAETIKSHGVLQPVVVEKDDDGGYILVMGERRTRAARIAGLTEIPALIRRFTPDESFTVALIENIQRANLNPIEEALAYKRLMDSGGLNQDAAAAKVGTNRATFANTLRLLKLPENMRNALQDGEISAGHARALLSVDDGDERLALFQKIKDETLTVRDAERLAGGRSTGEGGFAGKPDFSSAPPADGGFLSLPRSGAGTSMRDDMGANAMRAGGAAARSAKRDSELRAFEEKLIEALGTKVRLDGNFEKGIIKIEYYSMEDLERLYEIITETKE
jgi:ParB family chromosome partitioning protein